MNDKSVKTKLILVTNYIAKLIDMIKLQKNYLNLHVYVVLLVSVYKY